jgi:hypothetical protein
VIKTTTRASMGMGCAARPGQGLAVGPNPRPAQNFVRDLSNSIQICLRNQKPISDVDSQCGVVASRIAPMNAGGRAKKDETVKPQLRQLAK